MTDPRFTLPESPELLARAEAVARQRRDDWLNIYTARHMARPLTWDQLAEQAACSARATVRELRDLTRPASYDAALRWLAELLAPHEAEVPGDGLSLCRWFDGWRLHRGVSASLAHLSAVPAPIVPATVTDPREALVLALTAALEARHGA